MDWSKVIEQFSGKVTNLGSQAFQMALQRNHALAIAYLTGIPILLVACVVLALVTKKLYDRNDGGCILTGCGAAVSLGFALNCGYEFLLRWFSPQWMAIQDISNLLHR